LPGQATWTAEPPTSTREPPPTVPNAAIFLILAPRFRLIWTAVIFIISRLLLLSAPVL
jgi:hypothetical protein